MEDTVQPTSKVSLSQRAKSDQRCGFMITAAEEMCAYRNALRAGGMNKQESFKMVLEYQQVFWMKEFYPEDPAVGFEIDNI